MWAHMGPQPVTVGLWDHNLEVWAYGTTTCKCGYVGPQPVSVSCGHILVARGGGIQRYPPAFWAGGMSA